MKTTKEEMKAAFQGGVAIMVRGASRSPEVDLQDTVDWLKELIEDIEQEIEWEEEEAEMKAEQAEEAKTRAFEDSRGV